MLYHLVSGSVLCRLRDVDDIRLIAKPIGLVGHVGAVGVLKEAVHERDVVVIEYAGWGGDGPNSRRAVTTPMLN